MENSLYLQKERVQRRNSWYRSSIFISFESLQVKNYFNNYSFNNVTDKIKKRGNVYR